MTVLAAWTLLSSARSQPEVNRGVVLSDETATYCQWLWGSAGRWKFVCYRLHSSLDPSRVLVPSSLIQSNRLVATSPSARLSLCQVEPFRVLLVSGATDTWGKCQCNRCRYGSWTTLGGLALRGSRELGLSLRSIPESGLGSRRSRFHSDIRGLEGLQFHIRRNRSSSDPRDSNRTTARKSRTRPMPSDVFRSAKSDGSITHRRSVIPPRGGEFGRKQQGTSIEL